MNPVTPVFLSRSTRMLRPHKALRMLEEGNNALVKRVNEQSAALVQLWARMEEGGAGD